MTTTTQTTAWPLMQNNISRDDLDAVIDFLRQDDPILTQASNVRAFEGEWSEWLGVKHSVFVNSGSSANLLTLAALKELHGPGEVIVSPLNWVSDIAAVLHCGLQPDFADIDPRTLGMDHQQVISRLSSRTRAVLLTHILGYNALTQPLLDELHRREIPLIEDVCESHGATFAGNQHSPRSHAPRENARRDAPCRHAERGTTCVPTQRVGTRTPARKLGTFGLASNFSFYYAHHLSTIEGGMVCTDDEEFYETVRMLRSHGMVRELESRARREEFWNAYPDLNREFIFAYPAYNVRSTEINAVIGRAQLPRLDANVERRTENLHLFLRNLDPDAYQTDFETEGSSNYAFTLILRHPDDELCRRVMETLDANRIEYRRGTSGGGNQLRQPYLRRLLGPEAWKQCPRADHVHFYGFYIGNYPSLEQERILWLCDLLNELV